MNCPICKIKLENKGSSYNYYHCIDCGFEIIFDILNKNKIMNMSIWYDDYLFRYSRYSQQSEFFFKSKVDDKPRHYIENNFLFVKEEVNDICEFCIKFFKNIEFI